MAEEHEGRSISVDALRALIEAGEVVVDVRSAVEYAADHVPGAISVPADALPDHVDQLRQGAPLVTVCNHGGSRCQGAAARLTAEGVVGVRFLAGGLAAWAAARDGDG